MEAALLLPPFYFAKVTDAGLERWLRLVLEAAQLPVFLYNFPDHTGNFISPDVFRRLTHDFPLLRGLPSCRPGLREIYSTFLNPVLHV